VHIRQFDVSSHVGDRRRSALAGWCRITHPASIRRKPTGRKAYLYGRFYTKRRLETGPWMAMRPWGRHQVRERRDVHAPVLQGQRAQVIRIALRRARWPSSLYEFRRQVDPGSPRRKNSCADARLMRQGLLSRGFLRGNDDHDHRQNHIADWNIRNVMERLQENQAQR